VEYGRASSACDIQEEFRASVDRFTLYLINNKMICEGDFYDNPKDGSKYLKREMMKKWFFRELRHGFNLPYLLCVLLYSPVA